MQAIIVQMPSVHVYWDNVISDWIIIKISNDICL